LELNNLGKNKFVREEAVKTYARNRFIAPLSLNLGTSCRTFISFKLPVSLSLGKEVPVLIE
jgi:hypothetical protein